MTRQKSSWGRGGRLKRKDRTEKHLGKRGKEEKKGQDRKAPGEEEEEEHHHRAAERETHNPAQTVAAARCEDLVATLHAAPS